MTTFWLIGEMDSCGVLKTFPSIVSGSNPLISIKDEAKEIKQQNYINNGVLI